MTDFDKAIREGFVIKFNGRSTWMIIDRNGDSWGHHNTERKAINHMKRIGKCYQ